MNDSYITIVDTSVRNPFNEYGVIDDKAILICINAIIVCEERVPMQRVFSYSK